MVIKHPWLRQNQKRHRFWKVHCLTCFNEGNLDISTKQNKNPKILGLATIKAYVLLRLWFNVSWFVGEESGSYCFSAETLWTLTHTLRASCLWLPTLTGMRNSCRQQLTSSIHPVPYPCTLLGDPWLPGSLRSHVRSSLWLGTCTA